MTSLINRQVVLRRHPQGIPVAEDFDIESLPVTELPADHVRVRVDCISIDAFIRTTLDESGFHQRTRLGDPVVALGVGEVVASESRQFAAGDWVFGPVRAQSLATAPAAAFQRIEPTDAIPPSAFLGVLGLTTGLTAWVGMAHLAEPAAGETVVVSGAAGAVGTCAGQIAKAAGARVVGVAGGATKCTSLTQTLGLDEAVDYKAGNLAEDLAAATPNGIDVFFDNVGGELLDLVLDRLNQNARVIICGAISQYDDLTNVRGPKLYLRIAERNSTMRGFTVDRYAEHFPQATAELSALYLDGKLTLPEHVVSGIDQFPDALNTLLTGGHRGKMLVKP
ncbi:MAG: NADP-dependent oxidoreductase [Pseudomonadota bacterium]